MARPHTFYRNRHADRASLRAHPYTRWRPYQDVYSCRMYLAIATFYHLWILTKRANVLVRASWMGSNMSNGS